MRYVCLSTDAMDSRPGFQTSLHVARQMQLATFLANFLAYVVYYYILQMVHNAGFNSENQPLSNRNVCQIRENIV